MTQDPTPIVLAVAPNGARRGKADHPCLPIGAAELAENAVACRNAGASMLHLHIRDDAGRHLLDPGRYRDTAGAIAERVGEDFVIQLTTEAAGRYGSAEQRQLLRQLPAAFAGAPLYVSLGLREVDAALRPEGTGADAGLKETELADLFAACAADRIRLQVILYDAADLRRYLDLRTRGTIDDPRPSLLFVLGRYSTDGQSLPDALLPFLAELLPVDTTWMICAFGARESACAMAAATLGGHVRLGFENNLLLADGCTAPHNAALVEQLAGGLPLAGRRPASPAEARSCLGLPPP